MICLMPVTTHVNRDTEPQLVKECGRDERPDVECASGRKKIWMIADQCKAIVDRLVPLCAKFNQMFNLIWINPYQRRFRQSQTSTVINLQPML